MSVGLFRKHFVKLSSNFRYIFATRHWWASPLSLVILIFHIISYPIPVRDAATLHFVYGFHLKYPFWHLVLTPLSSIADTLTILGEKEIYVVTLWVIALILFIPGWRKRTFALLVVLLMITWTVLVYRPSGRLIHDDPDILLVDFHSHTAQSHDGRASFSSEANRRWHKEQGFDAGFITDHNLIVAAQEAMSASERDWKLGGYRSLIGEEVSLNHTHLLVLGNRKIIYSAWFDSHQNSIYRMIDEAHEHHALTVALLPDYWLYHWDAETDKASKNKPNVDGTIQQFITLGIDGFEIVNSSPKELDFPLDKRHIVVELCRERNLFMLGSSNNHGWGSATAAWNAIHIPGWQVMDPVTLQSAILSLLRTKRFLSVQVLERIRFSPHNRVQLALCPFGITWVYLRSLQFSQRIIWMIWIWGVLVFNRRLKF